MSDKIPQQTVECDSCGTEFRRNQAVIGYGAEFPEFAEEHGFSDDEEIKLCTDCAGETNRVPVHD